MKQQGFSLIEFVTIIAVILVLLFGGFMVLRLHKPSDQTEIPAETEALPTIPVTDYAPGLPNDQRTEITVRNADSTEQKFIISTATVDDFIKKLPPDERVIERGPVEGNSQ